MMPWPNYDEAYSFRVGTSPAVCNNFLTEYGADHLKEFTKNNTCTAERYFNQAWTTSFPQRDFKVEEVVKQGNDNEYFTDDAGWNIQDPFDIGESTDTSRDKTKAIHTYEIAHRYQNDGQWGIGCAMKGDMDSGSQRDTDEPGCVNGVFAHKVWDIGHQIMLSNWSEYNAVAGAFISHPDVLTRSDDDYMSLQSLIPDGSNPPTTMKERLTLPFDPRVVQILRRGNYLMRVQGMEEMVGTYQSTFNIKGGRAHGWATGIAMETSNPSGKAEDFSTGGLNCPVMTLADNPFWRADPHMWGPILRNLKMDVMPYCAPTRKTRPVMYRFWDKPYPTALYGGPIFHCAVAGNTTGKLSMANVPYYRKFLRDFMASDDSIMAWRASLGLPERDAARYPHNYANYWKVVDANKGMNSFDHAPGEVVGDITDLGAHAIWADMPQQKAPDSMRCPTEFIGLIDNPVYTPSRVGQTEYYTTDVAYYEAWKKNYVLDQKYQKTMDNPTFTTAYTPSRANHYVLLSKFARRNRGRLDALGLSATDTTLVYPPSDVKNPLTKMTMDTKRKLHRKNMHKTNSHAFHDFFATMFCVQKEEGEERRGAWEDAHLSHRIYTDALGIVSDGEVALLRDMMDKILKGADLATILPDGVLKNDKRAVSGWWSTEIAQTILMGLEDAKFTQLDKFRKWTMEKGSALVGPEFRRFCEWTKTAYPRLGKVTASFFENLELGIANMDVAMIDGGISFATAITGAFANAGIAAGVTALGEVLSGVKKVDPGKISRAVMNKLKNTMAQAKTAFDDFYEFQIRGDGSMASYVQEWEWSGNVSIDIKEDREWLKKTGRFPTASKMRFRSQEVYDKWRKEFYERLSTFMSDIEKVDERMGYMPEGLQTAISELYENVEAGRGYEILFTDISDYASPFAPSSMRKLAPKIEEWQKQVDGMKDWYRDYMTKYGATPWDIDQRGIQVTFAESFKGNVKPVLETSAAQPCELHPDTFLPDAEYDEIDDEENFRPYTPSLDDEGDFDAGDFTEDLPVLNGPTAAEDAKALADGLNDDPIKLRKAAYEKFLQGAAEAKKEGKMLNRTGLLPTDQPDILGRNYFDYGQVLSAPEGGEVESAALDLMQSAAPELATAEAAEGLAMTSIMAAGAELAPLILLFGITELLDYLQKQAEERAAAAEAYNEKLNIMNNFYEANVPLNRNFFTASELHRLSLLDVDPEKPSGFVKPRDPFIRKMEDDADPGAKPSTAIHWGTDKDNTPWVRFDLLTKFIVMNIMSLSMVDPDWLTNFENLDPDFLAYRVRQTEWLSTCETIRTMRLVDHHIRAPMWSDSKTADDDEGAFLPYHFPLTDEVPNGMIKHFMTPIPCVTPFDNGYTSTPGLNGKKDLYAYIFGDHERQTEVKVIPNPRIDAKDSQIVDVDGNIIPTQVLPDDVQAQVEADAKKAGITDITRWELEFDADNDGYVVYYHMDGKDVAYVTPEAEIWDKILQDPRYEKYGTIPTPFVVTKTATHPLTGKPTKIFDICEPVPVWAPDRSPTLFISSADPTFAWPTLREKGGNMNYLAKELNYFDTHKFTLVGEDGISVLSAGKDAIGNRQSRLIVQPNPASTSVIANSLFVVLTDSPEYSEEKWEAAKKALGIDETAKIEFLQATLDVGSTSGEAKVPLTKDMTDDEDNPLNPLTDPYFKDYKFPIPAMSTATSWSVAKIDQGGGQSSWEYTIGWTLSTIPLSAKDWYQYDYPHPLRVIDFSVREGEVLSVKPAGLYAVQDVNGLWIPPADHLRGEGYIPDGATFTRFEAYRIQGDDSTTIIDVPPQAINADGTGGTDPRLVRNPYWEPPLPDGAIIKDYDFQTTATGQLQYIIYWMIPYIYGIEFYYQLRESSFPDADYIIDFASTIDWVAFEKPGPTGASSCGELPPKKYQYMAISNGPFSMDNFVKYPIVLDILNGKPRPETMPDVPTPDALEPYLDLIKGLCYWKSFYLPPKITNEVINGVDVVTFDAASVALKSITNMGALPVSLFSVEVDDAKIKLRELDTLNPGDARLHVDLSGPFVFVLSSEVDVPSSDWADPEYVWQMSLMLSPDEESIGHVGRSLVMTCKPEDSFHLLVFDNPTGVVTSPKLVKLKALFAQILSLTDGTSCYNILRSFIQDCTYEILKPPSKLQEDMCDWILRHIRVDPSGAEGPKITPHTIERQIGLYHVGKALTKVDEYDSLYNKPYDVRAFLKKHNFRIEADCIAPYGPPTIEHDGPYLSTEIRLEESKDNPGWAESYSFLGMGLPDETRDITNLLIALQETAGSLGGNAPIVDDVLNNRLTDLEALPKCRAATSQHDKLVTVLHLAERVRRLRVNTVMRRRATEDDDMLEVLADNLEKTPDDTLMATSDPATAGFIDLIRKLPAIREHRTVVGKSALYTLSNHEAVCCQACKESYKDNGRSGLSTSTGEFYYIDSLSSPEMAYFYNPHSQHLLVACRGTSVQKDLDKGSLETGTLDELQTVVKNPPSMFASLKRKLSSAMSPMSDLYTDFMIVVGQQNRSPRLGAARDEVVRVVKEHAIKSVTMTGHSLGGSIATFVHQNLFEGGVDSSCVIFNPGIGMDQEYFDLVAQERTGKGAEWARHLTTFHVAGESGSLIQSDPVSFLSGGIGESKRQKAVTGAGVPKRLKAHSISNFHTGSVDLMAHVEYTIPKT
jgi:hypothetical protein